MATKSDRNLLILLSTVLAADAGREGISAAKRRVMSLHLRRRFPDLGLAERWELVGRALKGMPEIPDGIALLKLVAAQGEKLAAALEDDASREEAMLTLLDVASADGPISEPVGRVLRAAARPLGFADSLQLPA